MELFARIARFFLIFFLIFTVFPSFATKNLLIGKWQSHDEKTGKPSSIITIWQADGKYFGKISWIYSINGANDKDHCVHCKGALQNQPILGMTILRDLQRDGDKYKRGMIVDPRDGKEYRCVLSLSADGSQLYVRGYIGFSLFGRTAVWTRAS